MHIHTPLRKTTLIPVMAIPVVRWPGPGDHFDFLDEMREWNPKGTSDLPKATLSTRGIA